MRQERNIIWFGPNTPERLWRISIPKKWIERFTKYRIEDFGMTSWLHYIDKADVAIGRSFISPQAVDLCHLFNKKIFYEIDGAAPLFPNIHREKDLLQQTKYQNSQQYKTIQKCDGVLVSTKNLSEWVKIFYKGRIKLFPNYLDFEWWKSMSVSERRHDGVLRIGSFGMPSHENDMGTLIVPILERLSDPHRVEKRKLHYYFPKSVMRSIPRKFHSTISFVDPWSMESRPALVRSLGIDVMLVPLVDNQFNRCKSAIKYFENAADRVPGIYSPTVYKEYVNHGKTGFIAETVDDWIEYMDVLVQSEKLRSNLGDASYQDVLLHYSAERNYKIWIEAIDSLI